MSDKKEKLRSKIDKMQKADKFLNDLDDYVKEVTAQSTTDPDDSTAGMGVIFAFENLQESLYKLLGLVE